MPKITSIPVILQKLKSLEDKFKRFSTQIGYESPQTLKTLKYILNLSTSISIVFLYHNLLQLSLEVLKRALFVDVAIFFKGKKKDKSSPVRVILYNNLAFLHLKVGDYSSSVKFLYDSESLLLGLKETPEFSDLQIASSFVGLICMCQLGKMSEAHDYLESATEHFNAMIRDEKASRYNRESCSNLYSILTFIGELLQNPRAFNNFATFRQEMFDKFSREKNYASSFIVKIIRNTPCVNGLEILCLDVWIDFCYLNAFFPFILQGTPIVSTEEIVREKAKNKKIAEMPGFLTSKKKKDGAFWNGKEGNYSYLMKCALQSLK
jgi:hypothetical protein